MTLLVRVTILFMSLRLYTWGKEDRDNGIRADRGVHGTHLYTSTCGSVPRVDGGRSGSCSRTAAVTEDPGTDTQREVDPTRGTDVRRL